MIERTLEEIARNLGRLADVAEQLGKDTELMEQLDNERSLAKLENLVPSRYQHCAAAIVEIVIQRKYSKEIVSGLKDAGILSQSTYWKDVTLFHDVQRQVFGRQQ